MEFTERDKTRFAIAMPNISQDVCTVKVELGGKFKRQLPFTDISLVLA